ncbi:hypothetical protein EC973_002010 [Apophysomyces ossiformis]|uniref:Uncharacterized protein n=1 Tax=Apophysomyces ossiformis TaxID=679940 RepID=A0A8H7EN71_9FUNG|nr:hypothetical protein EC973_002010 [Apophysomyces ossiformis]
MPVAVISNPSSSPSSKKSFKWTAQRITSPKSGRVHKRTPSNASSKISSPKVNKVKQMQGSEIERLESELAFTYDSLATITVMFDSLRLAYANCKNEIEKSKSETRLGEMEKELLTAYDDLGLQVTHLEREIIKLEKRLMEIRPTTTSTTETGNHSDYPPSPPQPPREEQQQQLSQQPASPASTISDQYPLSYSVLQTPPSYAMSPPMPATSYYSMPIVAQTMPMPESDCFTPYSIPTTCFYDPATIYPTSWTYYPTSH